MVIGDNGTHDNKIAGKLLVVLMAMAMQQYNAMRIAQWSTSRATLEATRCCHWASACTVSVNYFDCKHNNTIKTLTKHNFQLATTVQTDH